MSNLTSEPVVHEVLSTQINVVLQVILLCIVMLDFRD